jgi:hypothetical protein
MDLFKQAVVISREFASQFNKEVRIYEYKTRYKELVSEANDLAKEARSASSYIKTETIMLKVKHLLSDADEMMRKAADTAVALKAKAPDTLMIDGEFDIKFNNEIIGCIVDNSSGKHDLIAVSPDRKKVNAYKTDVTKEEAMWMAWVAC